MTGGGGRGGQGVVFAMVVGWCQTRLFGFLLRIIGKLCLTYLFYACVEGLLRGFKGLLGFNSFGFERGKGSVE